MVPVLKSVMNSASYLQPAEGIYPILPKNKAGGNQNDFLSPCRGMINWNNTLVTVFGDKLIVFDNIYATEDNPYEGEVYEKYLYGDYTAYPLNPGGTPVTMTYGFDLLAIASSGKLFYFNGTTVTEVTDPNLGVCKDVVWIDGYYVSTDGQYIVVSELNEPTTFNPLKYGSSEANPDPIVALLRVQNELVALNRHTVEYYSNVGGTGFPFARTPGAQLQKGTYSATTCCVFQDNVAFVGSALNEQPGIYIGAGGALKKISTRDIDIELALLAKEELPQVFVQERVFENHFFLLVHLPTKTYVYDATSSDGAPIWHVLASNGLTQNGAYQARYHTYAFDYWFVGNPFIGQIGYLTYDTMEHYGRNVTWEFQTPIMFNAGNGFIVDRLQLICLTGAETNGTIFTSHSPDGRVFGTPIGKSTGKVGETSRRIEWRKQGLSRFWRVQRFTGDSNARVTIASLLADIQPLAW